MKRQSSYWNRAHNYNSSLPEATLSNKNEMRDKNKEFCFKWQLQFSILVLQNIGLNNGQHWTYNKPLSQIRVAEV